MKLSTIFARGATTALVAAQVALSIPVLAKHEGKLGAVASESTICSRIGTRLLEAGGNAADAMVGTVFCVGVIGMYHSGIGGGGFMLVRAPKGTYEVIDFRETAPAAAFEDMYKNNINGSVFGGLASGVPGEVRGLELLHRNYGSLPWRTVVEPAVKVARHGFIVTKDLIRYMESATSGNDFLSRDPVWAIDFAPNGTRVGLGDRLTRKRYANTLEAIAKKGSKAFYTGDVAKATIRALRATNGTMTLEDLKEYKAVRRNSKRINYRNFRIVSCGAPSSGTVALSALKTVQGYGGFQDPAQLNLSTHRLDEAIRFGYGERANLGDPNFLKGISEYESEMLNETTAAGKRSKISDQRTLNVSDYDPLGYESLETHGTSHVITGDSNGMAISLTSTINLLFGSQLMVPETGVIMNNEMNDFSIPNVKNAFGYVPSPANYVRPGKRPLSSITPTIVEHLANHSLYYVVGAAGGSRIITATIQNLWHVLDQGLTAPQALAQPRFHDQLVPNIISFEWASVPALKNGSVGTVAVKGYDNSTVAFMKARGHMVTWVAPGFSSAQAIRLLNGGAWEAAGEPRQSSSGGFTVR